MMRSTRQSVLLMVTYGIIAAIGDATACAAVSLKSFLTVPIWVPFLPATLAWIAAGIRGMKHESMIGVGAISLIGGPMIAAMMVSLPMPLEDRMAASFSTIRHSLAISIAVMLPLSIMCILTGVVIRGAIESHRLQLPDKWRQ